MNIIDNELRRKVIDPASKAIYVSLIENIRVGDSKKENSSPSSSSTCLALGLTNNDLDLLKKLQTQII